MRAPFLNNLFITLVKLRFLMIKNILRKLFSVFLSIIFVSLKFKNIDATKGGFINTHYIRLDNKFDQHKGLEFIV